MDLKQWTRLHWDRIGAWTLAVVGVVVLLVGWKRVADTPFPAEQIPYLVSAGIGGGLMIVFGAALLISADLRDEWTKLDEIHATLARQQAPPSADDTATPAAAPVTNGTATVAADVGDAPNGNGSGTAPRRRPVRAGTAK
jgi:hypothetical protein